MSVDHAVRHINARDRILNLLEDLEWHPHFELARVGQVRYSARVLELKRLGWQIESRTISTGTDGDEYRLVSRVRGQPQAKRVKVLMSEEDVITLLKGELTLAAREALVDALASFKANKHKL